MCLQVPDSLVLNIAEGRSLYTSTGGAHETEGHSLIWNHIKNFNFKSQVIQTHVLGKLEQTSYSTNICKVGQKVKSL